ncbi:MAG: VOC family protein [Saprospiraceae bacterium]|nr:VOC family protein [Saprospiraceae bacterium]MCB0543782.1 VOC family protein [Saprospiraceae bacterium]MCB0574357.1 VOC family protein [Saprospiraceae bacterium]MCB9306083.1 VOC family protein [Lewinellaceae bacterium]MCB9356225.1 VOC family protein [Lewinellaceae bacterium]
MKKLNVYLTFPGTCEEALNFYKDCLGGRIVSMQRFGESPVNAPDDYKQKVMHAVLESEGVLIMASDAMPDQPVTVGNNVHLSLDFSDAADQETVFNKLSTGGQVYMPLEKTFWGAVFGMLADKYGTSWLLNRDVSSEQ